MRESKREGRKRVIRRWEREKVCVSVRQRERRLGAENLDLLVHWFTP